MLSAVTEYNGGEAAITKALNGVGKYVATQESANKYDAVGIGEMLRKDLGIQVSENLPHCTAVVFLLCSCPC